LVRFSQKPRHICRRRPYRVQQLDHVRRQIGLFNQGNLLLRLADIGLEGLDTLGLAGRQHSPIGDAHKQNLGFERIGSRDQRRPFSSVHEFLHVRRHLVAIGEQKPSSGLHLLDRLADLDPLCLQFGDVLHQLSVLRLAFFRARGSDGFLEQV
jgi:hypothetical protein